MSENIGTNNNRIAELVCKIYFKKSGQWERKLLITLAAFCAGGPYAMFAPIFVSIPYVMDTANNEICIVK